MALVVHTETMDRSRRADREALVRESRALRSEAAELRVLAQEVKARLRTTDAPKRIEATRTDDDFDDGDNSLQQ